MQLLLPLLQQQQLLLISATTTTTITITISVPFNSTTPTITYQYFNCKTTTKSTPIIRNTYKRIWPDIHLVWDWHLGKL